VLTKFGFRIKTRGGMIVENLTVAARDRTEAERKVTQIYHHCEILECQELQQSVKEDGFSLDSAITLIGKETDPGTPGKS
jgi:hypothetical protein